MTEAEWLACDELTSLLTHLRGETNQRNYGLFAVACCQRIRASITDERSRWAVAIAERFADGVATQRQRRGAYRSVRAYADDFAPDQCAASAVHRHAFLAACGAADAVSLAVGAGADFSSTASDRLPRIESARVAERMRQGKVLHDLFGNPFRPLTFAADDECGVVSLLDAMELREIALEGPGQSVGTTPDGISREVGVVQEGLGHGQRL